MTQSTTVDLSGAPIPREDGAVNEYTNAEALAEVEYFDRRRRVVFINGMNNSGEDHAESALALSLVQMCTVIGVYNRSEGAVSDLQQCLGDKNQFNGFSASAMRSIGRAGRAAEARRVLSRNPASVSLFDVLRRSDLRSSEIFAHSQGNLILSNVLQAIAAVDGPTAVAGRVVHTFGSPAVNWPKGVNLIEHGFTWDPVTWLAGFDTSLSISKVGWPKGSLNPITHSFLMYAQHDPAFVVNRFRWGSLGMTASMDEAGLASCLAAMGTNMPRVRSVFEHLAKAHSSDSDDVALEYVEIIKAGGAYATTVDALKRDRAVIELLTRCMATGWTSDREKKAIAWLKAL